LGASPEQTRYQVANPFKSNVCIEMAVSDLRQGTNMPDDGAQEATKKGGSRLAAALLRTA
jgi:hypothetical protein